MKSIKQLLGGDTRQYGMVVALIALIAFFQIKTDGKVLTSTNAINVINGNAYVFIIAIGMVMVIVIGQIDLAVGSVAAVVAYVVALSIRDWGVPWWVGVLLGLLTGMIIGAWQGFWLAYVGIAGFITTLAGQMLFRGIQQYIGKATATPVPKEVKYLGSGVLPQWGPDTGLNNSTLLLGVLAVAFVVWVEIRKRNKLRKLNASVPPIYLPVIRIVILAALIGYATYLFGSGSTAAGESLSFPVAGVIVAVLVIVYHFITQRTPIGRAVYAVGGNKIAAGLTGINVRRTYFLTMANVSFLAAIAGVVGVGRSGAAGGTDGTNWELDAITAVFIGGAAVSGGIGTVMGTVVGGLVMAFLNNGLNLIGAGADITKITKGLVLLAAVAFDVYNKSQNKPSITGALARGLHISRGKKSDGPAGPSEVVTPDPAGTASK